MFTTLGTTLVGLISAGCVSVFRLDVYHLLLNELTNSTISDNKLIDAICFLLTINFGQMMVIVLQGLFIPLVFQLGTRMCLLYSMSKKSPTIF